MSAIIEIVGPDGAITRYRRLSARIPEFLARFPPEAGYRVATELTDLLSLQPARLALLRELTVLGRRLEDLGLAPPTEVMVCSCTLLGPKGEPIVRRHAARLIQDYKDMEILETAAYQRLLAGLGFGGELLDADEDADVAAQGLHRAPSAAAVTALLPRRGRAPRQVPEPAAAAERSQAPAPTAEGPAPQDSTSVPPALAQQLAQLAAQLGERPPAVTSSEAAREALHTLGERLRAQRAARAPG
jgi:hypothetical protein